MHQINKHVAEINKAFKKFDFGKGTMRAEDVNACVALLKEAHANVRTAIQVEAMAKRGHKIIETLDRMNFYSNTTAVDAEGDAENDKVKCPEHDHLITRAECLDYSGSHIDECMGCEIGKATKDKLCPIK